jgi:hypothetical protein
VIFWNFYPQPAYVQESKDTLRRPPHKGANMAKTLRLISAASLGILIILSAGCRIEDHKNGDGKSADVKIATPFGGMSVKTDQSVVEGGVGLAVYPGAVLEKKETGKDSGAADVNVNVFGVHVAVKALSYRTPDSADKVLAFYRKDMARYGAVILCSGNHAVGSPDHTQDGLTCDKQHGNNINIDDDRSQQELKAGSQQHQHIVAIENDGASTKIGLVALELPGHMKGDKDDVD